MITHYIPYYTRESGRKRQAVCGRYVLACDHSQEPTCQTCAAYQREAEKLEQAQNDAMGFEVVDGLLLSKDEAAR